MNGIRRANEGDIPELLRLLVQVDMVHHEGRPDLFKGPATKYTAEELRILLKDEKRPVFACPGEDGKILGYAFCAVKRYENDHVMTDVKTCAWTRPPAGRAWAARCTNTRWTSPGASAATTSR